LDETAFETIRLEVERGMREMQAEEDRRCGWRESLFSDNFIVPL